MTVVNLFEGGLVAQSDEPDELSIATAAQAVG
jgi:hypothetical protein